MTTNELSILTLQCADQPGIVAAVSALIAEVGGNIVDVTHHRLFLDVPAKAADLDFTVETRDAEHTSQLEAALQAAGLTPRILQSSKG
jgi:threonine dehydratase